MILHNKRVHLLRAFKLVQKIHNFKTIKKIRIDVIIKFIHMLHKNTNTLSDYSTGCNGLTLYLI